jgi:hypothetical protein
MLSAAPLGLLLGVAWGRGGLLLNLTQLSRCKGC